MIFFVFGAAQANAQAGGEITPKGITFPRYTDANRPAGPLVIGTTIFNTSQNTHQYWNGSSWTNVSTPGSGGGPWSAVGSSVFNNTGNRVGINSPNPAADLEIQGGGGLLVSAPYTVTTSPPTNTYTMPYNGTLAVIADDAGRVLDPGGNGNFITNTNYASFITLQPTSGGNGFRFTFESLDLGGSIIIFSGASDVTDTDAYILSINQNSNYATGRPFNINGSVIYIHNKITSGGTAAAGFQLLFERLVNSSSSKIHSEAMGLGLSFSRFYGSLASGNSRARGYYSTALGNTTVRGDYSTAMGNSIAYGVYSTAMGQSYADGIFSTAIGNATARGEYSTAMGGGEANGYYSTAMGRGVANGAYSTAMGYNSTASGPSSTAMGYSGNTNSKMRAFSIGGNLTTSRAANDKDYQMKMHFQEFQLLTGAAHDFIITEGLISTNNTLDINGYTNRAITNYGYLSNTAPTGIYTGSATPLYSIYASNRIMGQEFNAFSDARHKKLRSYSNSSIDLALLNQLKVSNYTFIDTVGKGTKMQMGFIAQEVEKIVPDAVNKIQDYIPSIYDMAKSIAYDATAHTLTVSTNKAHDFEAKDQIKLISLDKEHKVKVESIIDANTFVVANWEKPVDKLFVFGKRVDDFRTVDYDRLFTLGISSIQELSRRVEQLEQENRQLKAYKEEFAQMKNEMAELKPMISGTAHTDKVIDK